MLFAIGATCFALSALPDYAEAVGVATDGVTFFVGSICFLVASGIAWACATHAWWVFQPHRLPWWIAGFNLLGSIAFGISAVASKVAPESDQERNVTLMNLGTFVGALGFLIAAVLLLPERTQTEAAHGGEGQTVRA